MGIYQLTDRIIDPGAYPWGYGYLLWTPAEITTALWLDAADSDTITLVSGAVSQWDDKSGNARHFIQSNTTYRPIVENILNSKNVVVFGSGDFLVGVDYGNTSEDGYFYCLVAMAESYGHFFMAQVMDGNDREPALMTAPTGGYGATSNHFGVVARRRFSGDWAGVAIPNYTAGQTVLFFGQYDNSGAKAAWSGSFNGDINAVSGWGGRLNEPSTPLPNSTGNTYLGKRASSGSLVGHIAEIVVGKNALPTDDRQKLEGYLAHKWGLAANLPSDHPYKTFAPRA